MTHSRDLLSPDDSNGSDRNGAESTEPWWIRHRYLVLVGFAAIVHVAVLGRRDLWYPDEPDIAQVARTMYVSNDWIVPRFNGEVWVDYMPMLYWAGTISAHLLGGVSEFALRLPSALAALGLALATCAMGSRWYDRRAGLLAGLLLLTFAMFSYNSVSYRPDILFSLGIGLGIFAYSRAFSGKRATWIPRVVAFAAFGMAMLVKGPLGLLLPGLILTCWHAGRREWKPLLQQAPLVLISLLVIAPWCTAFAEAVGWDRLWSDVRAQNFDRFEGGAANSGHEQPWHFYITRFWGHLAPWSVLAPFAIWWLFKSGAHRDRWVQLALWWFGASFVFLTVATTKRGIYLLPAYPAMALLLAPWVTAIGRTAGAVPPDPRPLLWFARASGIALVVIGALGFLGATGMSTIIGTLGLEGYEREVAAGLRLPLVFLGIVALATFAWTRRGMAVDGLRAVVERGVLGTGALLFVLGFSLFPAFNPAKTYVPACEWISAEIGASTHLGILYPVLGNHKKGAFGYYTGALVDYSLATEADIDRFLERHPDSVVLVEEQSAEALSGDRWRGSIVRELFAGRRNYFVVKR